jgi:tRNA threonylcarbamoyladenosine biosynthesis protein TsaB
MVVLALDTTTRRGSVAVLRDERVLIERSGDPEIPHGRRLPGDVLAALTDARLALADVHLFAVASGPGAFTGLRIGIATIQGLAFAHRKPVTAVSALSALANVARAETRAAAGTFVASWMDAARGEVFSALYEVGDEAASELVERDEPSVAAPDATLERWRSLLNDRAVVFAGEGAVRYADRITAALAHGAVVLPHTPPLAGTIGRLALQRGQSAGPPHAVRPLYVRRPDAELAREQNALTGKSRG